MVLADRQTVDVLRLRLWPVRVFDRVQFYFCGEGESECTSERARGQFSIFGAIEEKNGRGLGRTNMGQEESWKGAVKRCGGDGSLLRPFGEGEFRNIGSRNIHRGRTGNAESGWWFLCGLALPRSGL